MTSQIPAVPTQTTRGRQIFQSGLEGCLIKVQFGVKTPDVKGLNEKLLLDDGGTVLRAVAKDSTATTLSSASCQTRANAALP